MKGKFITLVLTLGFLAAFGVFMHSPPSILDGLTGATPKAKCDTKSRNVLRVNATLSIWSNPTVTCTGQKPALGSSQDNMGNLPA